MLFTKPRVATIDLCLYYSSKPLVVDTFCDIRLASDAAQLTVKIKGTDTGTTLVRGQCDVISGSVITTQQFTHFCNKNNSSLNVSKSQYLGEKVIG